MKWLEPGGPHGVGSIATRLVDPARSTYVGNETPGRALAVKVWYPSDAASGPAERLWEELRRDPQTPAGMRLMLRLLRKRTSTRAGAAIATRGVLRSVVVYNHGLISFASENTSLMEHLASRGHVVLALRHLEQAAELKALSGRKSAEERKADAERQRRLAAAKRDERLRLAVEHYRHSTTTNRIVVERARDTSFALDRLEEILVQIPGFDEPEAVERRAQLVGFSLGGAVSGEAAAHDRRIESVVNLDGGMYGTQPPATIRQPYLMMYSSANDGVNDALLPEHAEREAPAQTAHLNYHDVSALMPLLGLTGAVGKVNARAFLEHRNRVVARFVARAAGASRTAAAAVS